MRRINKTGAFTLVEILTTMVIIGILLAVLIPALNQVNKSAMNVKQKAQFHTLEMGLETFRTDTGDYPASYFLLDPSLSSESYCSSQRLAEAMIGRDGLGFHPSSLYHPKGLADMDSDGAIDDLVYHAQTDMSYETALQNRQARKGPYLELESANAVKLSDIYLNYSSLANSYVLVDSFSKVKHRTTGKKIGMPILYYRADRNKIGNDPTTPLLNTYNIYDATNGLLSLDPPFGGSHPMRSNYTLFYSRIRNPNFTSPDRPYRSESFILQSAGYDGLFGTADDVYNFDEGK